MKLEAGFDKTDAFASWRARLLVTIVLDWENDWNELSFVLLVCPQNIAHL
jgi:hypothetical protein